MIYLDNAATTAMSQASLNAYRKVAEDYFGNPSSLHDYGSEAERVLESSRGAIAGILGVQAKGVHFTGSGSEANFLAITSMAEANRDRGLHIVTTGIEHSSVRNTFEWLGKRGFDVTVLPVDTFGRVRPDDLLNSLRDDTILVSIQHVNSEIGAIQDLESIGKILHERSILFHSDLVQSFCKIPLDITACRLSSVTITAHKIHGPKGIGAVYIDNSSDWKPFIQGTTQERGFRAGTVDVPAVVAFAVAAGDMMKNHGERLQKVEMLRNKLVRLIETDMGHLATLEGDPENISPYIVGMTLNEMEGQHAMLESNRFGLAISTGSACQVNEQKPSATMMAVGKSEQEARRLIRLSLSHVNSEDDIQKAVDILLQVASKHQSVVKL